MKPDHATPPAPDLLDLSGRRALVTGASGNIGRGIALRLAEAGAEVVGEHEAGELVIVTRSLDDWYEIIYNDGATRHAWLPQSAITFAALSVVAQEPDAAPEESPAIEAVEEPVAEIVAVSAPAKTAAPASTEQGVIVYQQDAHG